MGWLCFGGTSDVVGDSVVAPARPIADESKGPPMAGLGGQATSDVVRRDKHEAASRLRQLRGLLAEEKLDYYVVPSTDAHASEFLAPCDERRSFISGFTGSAGTAIVGREEALLFTDSRYWIQAAQQLSSDWQLQKVGSPGVLDWATWLEKTASAGSRIGIDPSLLSASSADRLSDSLDLADKRLVYPSKNLVDIVWGDDRPERSPAPFDQHPLRFAGVSADTKIHGLRNHLQGLGSEGFVTSNLADIMWLLNIRGSDVPFNPFVFSHLFVSARPEPDLSAVGGAVVLFIEPGKVRDRDQQYLASIGVSVKAYDGIVPFLRGLPSPSKDTKKTLLLSGDLTLSVALASAVPSSYSLRLIPSPIESAKAIKNPTEIEGFRHAYRRDAVSWVKWVAWLNEEMDAGHEVNEWDAAEKLTSYREKNELFAGLAYENISATNENAALPHYEPTKEKSRVIDKESPYLNDSGPQYLDGTIDTTRTYHFGKPTPAQKLAYTAVLKGHIAVASAVWPADSDLTGAQLDALARLSLSKLGCTYGHGTGHGVGSFLGVHEGPQNIGPSRRSPGTILRPGHVLTIEPGYYKEGAFGIRTESCFVVQEVERPHGELLGDKDGGQGKWLGFERFTQIPIPTNLIDYSLLSVDEKKWLRQHNDECKRIVGEMLHRHPVSMARNGSAGGRLLRTVGRVLCSSSSSSRRVGAGAGVDTRAVRWLSMQ